MPCTLRLILMVICFNGLVWISSSYGQISKTENPANVQDGKPVQQVAIKPSASDKQIQKRLLDILQATHWFEATKVRVQDGVVFLQGEAKTQEHRQWAEDLAQNTENVVAVVNDIDIVSPTSWYLKQIMTGIQSQWQHTLRGFPYFVFAVIVIVVFWLIARLLWRYTRKSLRARAMHPLLSDVIARTIALFFLLIGMYLVLQILGLTTMALTVLGGTGLLGIILGIAFRDITENLLASVLLSIQNPFQNGDLIEVDGVLGFVQSLTIRATVLITLEGQQVQIPNSTVYKSNIVNFVSNPNRRESFVIGIGYEDAISHAQAIALTVLQDHPAVLKDPEPWILVEELAPSTVNLRVYFWLNGKEYHWRKVKSSVIRLVKRAFQDAGISLPGTQVELHFPQEVPIELSKTQEKETSYVIPDKKMAESSDVSSRAEGGLGSEVDEIKQQAQLTRPAGAGENLLKSPNE